MTFLNHLFAVGFLMGATHGQTTSEDSLFRQANALYDLGKFHQAAQTYESILNEAEHPNLYYNLGNAYYRMGSIGQAVWAFEKGLQFTPRDQDLIHNIALVNTRVKDRIEFPRGMVAVDLYRAFKNKITLQDGLYWGGILLMLTALVWFFRQMGWLPFLGYRILIIPAITGAVVMHAVALNIYWEISEKQEAVVVKHSAEARSAPLEEEERILFRIHEGTVVEITQRQPEWTEIILLDGKKGWVPIETMREL